MAMQDAWADPKVKWKQAMIHECLSAEINSPDDAMPLACLLADVADGRENRKFPLVSPEFVSCLTVLAESSYAISLEFEETGLICEGDAEEIVKAFITCAANLLVAPDYVLKFFGILPEDHTDLRVAKRHAWTELLLTQGGQKLVVEAALAVGVHVLHTKAIDLLITEALRKFDLEQVFQHAVRHLIDPKWVQQSQIKIISESFN
jgi:hypothetical protein